MPSEIVHWINDRWPLNAVIRWSLDEEMPGGAGFAYVFGSCVLLIFLLQVVTGIWQLLYFDPTVDRGHVCLKSEYLKRFLYRGVTLHLRA
jgi:ubiquinol-cytochrome c reductase cytochrome b subunit